MPATEDRTVAARVPADLRADLEELARRRPDGELTPIIRAALRQYADAELGRGPNGGAGLLANGNGPTVPDRPGPLVPAHELRAWVQEQAADDGVICPTCDQYARVYRRRLHTSMALALITCYRRAGREPFHLPSLVPERGDTGKLRCWGLMEPVDEPAEHGKTSGWWRITARGEAFVRGRLVVPSHALIYNGASRGLTGELITIRDALGHRFDYAELMAA